MKYWNKQHEVRERCWYKVPVSSTFQMWRAKAKRHLQNEPSPGKFWINKEGPLVFYFQHEKDAIWFALKYS